MSEHTTVSFRLTREEARRAHLLAAARGISLSELLRSTVAAQVDELVRERAPALAEERLDSFREAIIEK